MAVEQLTLWPEPEAKARTLFVPAGVDPIVTVEAGSVFFHDSGDERWVFTIEETFALLRGMRPGDYLVTGICGNRKDMLAVSCADDGYFDLHFERSKRFRNPRRSSPIIEAYLNAVDRNVALSVVQRLFEEGTEWIVDAPGWQCEHYPRGLSCGIDE